MVTLILGIVLGAVLLVAVIVVAMFFNIWLQAKVSGVPVPIVRLMLIRLRRVSVERLILARITLAKAGLQVSLNDLETHVLAGGTLQAVVDALIAADKADLDVDFRRLAAIDLAGRNVVDAVRSHVNPKVLRCPDAASGQQTIMGVAKDGIRIAAKARITVRTQLDRLVGGAGEDTIIARVGEGIVAAIGGAESHREILERPEVISDYLLAKGLDSGTCFEIVSVDVADVDVIDNIAARLQSAQAEADTRIAQAHAEVRRAAAVAVHHEMTARTTEMEGRFTSAKSVVPLAVSSAVHENNMGSHRPVPVLLNTRIRWQAAGK